MLKRFAAYATRVRDSKQASDDGRPSTDTVLAVGADILDVAPEVLDKLQEMEAALADKETLRTILRSMVNDAIKEKQEVDKLLERERKARDDMKTAHTDAIDRLRNDHKTAIAGMKTDFDSANDQIRTLSDRLQSEHQCHAALVQAEKERGEIASREVERLEQEVNRLTMELLRQPCHFARVDWEQKVEGDIAEGQDEGDPQARRSDEDRRDGSHQTSSVDAELKVESPDQRHSLDLATNVEESSRHKVELALEQARVENASLRERLKVHEFSLNNQANRRGEVVCEIVRARASLRDVHSAVFSAHEALGTIQESLESRVPTGPSSPRVTRLTPALMGLHLANGHHATALRILQTCDEPELDSPINTGNLMS